MESKGEKLNMKNALIFLTGVLCGGAGVYFYLREKVDEEINREIESIRDELQSYREKDKIDNHIDKLKQVNSQRQKADAAKNKPDIMASRQIIESTNYSKAFEPEFKEQETWPDPYIISEEEFAASENNVISLNYHTRDRILADDNGHEEQIEDTIGDEALIQLLEGDDDVIYVRNEKLNIDYEVLLSDKDFEGVVDGEDQEITEE